jgi:hypothetical protein
MGRKSSIDHTEKGGQRSMPETRMPWRKVERVWITALRS